MNQDESQLNSLALAHYIVGAIGILASCLPLIHVFFGALFIWGGCGFLTETTNAPSPIISWIVFVMGIVWFVFAQIVSVMVIYSGSCLKSHKRYLYSFVTACCACTFFPLGTVLGVLTVMVLSRSTVKELYTS